MSKAKKNKKWVFNREGLKTLRKEKKGHFKCTLQRLSEILEKRYGIKTTQQNLSMIERGRSYPSFSLLIALSKYFRKNCILPYKKNSFGWFKEVQENEGKT